ncbi:MAG: DUF3179 domain-containing protein [Candidatus Latescibacteria bacterium]|nr:DUF3179 domain-containing protein [bacterium]MCB9514330.1 DUF3179 domain-containing protein [Candidatus Latescibacterota bacterium]
MILGRRNAWLFAVAFLLGMLALSWQLNQRRAFEAGGLRGDGKHLETYGFDLSDLAIPRSEIVPSGVPRDGLPALSHPPRLDAAGLAALNAKGREPFLMGSDRVLGVAANGAACAYPVSILNWHEVVNDTLGGEALLVTWNPLCGAACAYASEGVAFGVSGLFYNSNLLLYDRGTPSDSTQAASLWSQLTGRALAGPAAARGDSLARVPVALTRWDDWLARHPGTAVLEPSEEGLARKYRRRPYVSYLGSDRLQYPARPLPDEEATGLSLKSPVLSVWTGGERRLYPLAWIAARADADGRWQDTLAGRALAFRVWPGDPPVATVTSPDGAPVTCAEAFWFAWYSQEPLATRWLAGEPTP